MVGGDLTHEVHYPYHSKGHAALCAEKPYGSEVEIKKNECVGHVQKRITAHLKNARSSFKHDKAAGSAKVKELKGRMTQIRKEYGLGRARQGSRRKGFWRWEW